MLVESRTINKVEVATVTSLDVAETFGKEHKNVLKDIRNLECSEEFSRLNYEPSEYKDIRGKMQPLYYLTRDGFTLLVMGYTGEKAMKFKEAYIKQFNAMEKALRDKDFDKRIEREKGIAVRQALTKAIQQSNENERMHGHAYSVYTDLGYKILFGKNALQLKAQYGLTKKQNLRDCFSAEELAAVQNIEMYIGSLVNIGWGYEDIKRFVNEQYKIKIETKED